MSETETWVSSIYSDCSTSVADYSNTIVYKFNDYLGQLAEPVAPQVPLVEDDIAWLRRRVNETLWH